MIDNTPSSYMLNKDNGIPINSWVGDKNDQMLYSLVDILIFLSSQNDVRQYISQFVSSDSIILPNINAILTKNSQISNNQNYLSKFQYNSPISNYDSSRLNIQTPIKNQLNGYREGYKENNYRRLDPARDQYIKNIFFENNDLQRSRTPNMKNLINNADGNSAFKSNNFNEYIGSNEVSRKANEIPLIFRNQNMFFKNNESKNLSPYISKVTENNQSILGNIRERRYNYEGYRKYSNDLYTNNQYPSRYSGNLQSPMKYNDKTNNGYQPEQLKYQFKPYSNYIPKIHHLQNESSIYSNISSKYNLPFDRIELLNHRFLPNYANKLKANY